MPEQVITTIEAWHNRLQLVREVRAAIAEHEATIKAAKQRFEEEVAEQRSRLGYLRQQEATVMAGIKDQAVANFEASGQKTFAGVQLRKQERLRIVDQAEAIAILECALFNDKPIVKKVIDERAALGWVKAMQSMSIPVAWATVEVDYSVALIDDSEAANE